MIKPLQAEVEYIEKNQKNYMCFDQDNFAKLADYMDYLRHQLE